MTVLAARGMLAGEVDGERSHRGSRLRASSWLVWALFFVVAFVASAWWFDTYHFHTLTGDDLGTWLGENSLHGWGAGLRNVFVGTTDSKYRPLSALVLLVSYHAFGTFFTGYQVLNLLVEALNVTLFGLLVWRLSRSRVLTVGLSAVALMACFDLYFILQTFGACEGLCITFLLLCLLAARRGLQGATAGMAGADLAYFAAVYTHERYLGMGPALVILPLVATRAGRAWRGDLRWRLGWAAAPCAIAGSNVIVKAVLGVHFLTGTGGTNIALVPSAVISFFEQGAQSLLGFNEGPSYLSGASWNMLPHSEGLLFGAGFAATVLLFIATAAVRELFVPRAGGGPWLRRLTGLRVPLLGVLLGSVLLVLACTTINLQYRFLYAPYMLLLLGAAWAAGRWRPATPVGRSTRSRRQKTMKGLWVTCCLLLVAFGLAVQVSYRPYAGNTYFFQAQYTADDIYQQVVVHDAAKLDDTTILIETGGGGVIDNWILGGGSFFSLYTDGRPTDIRLVTSPGGIKQEKRLRKHVLLLVYNNAEAVVPTPLPK